ncbi:MAG: hypothetical protein ACJAYU_002843 [Bradymonadia bacterium]
MLAACSGEDVVTDTATVTDPDVGDAGGRTDVTPEDVADVAPDVAPDVDPVAAADVAPNVEIDVGPPVLTASEDFVPCANLANLDR